MIFVVENEEKIEQNRVVPLARWVQQAPNLLAEQPPNLLAARQARSWSSSGNIRPTTQAVEGAKQNKQKTRPNILGKTKAEKSFLCEKCNSRFQSKADLNNHYRGHKEGIKPWANVI